MRFTTTRPRKAWDFIKRTLDVPGNEGGDRFMAESLTQPGHKVHSKYDPVPCITTDCYAVSMN